MYNHTSSSGNSLLFPPFNIVSNDDDADGHWSSLVGIVTSIVGNIIISFALNTQRYAHVRIEREFNEDQEKIRLLKRSSQSKSGYGSAIQQEHLAEERSRLNAEAAGPGKKLNGNVNGNANGNTNGYMPSTQRKPSSDSDRTVKPLNQKSLDQARRKSYLRSPVWWVGIVLMAIGETGNFLAYGFAPASIVGPLGVVALISNCLVAPLMLKEPFRQRDFWGVLVAVGGVVTVVLSANSSESTLSPGELWDSIVRWEFLTYIGITCFLIVVLMYLSPRYGKKTILIDLGLVGLFGGYTALSTKGIASMLSASLWMALTFPITYGLLLVLVLSAIMQIRYINRALSNYASTQVIPVQFVLFTLSVILGSAVLYRDFEKTTLDQAIKFIVGCLLTFSGVWLITSGRKKTNPQLEPREEGDQDETIHLIDEEAEMEEERTSQKIEQRLADSTINETTTTTATAIPQQQYQEENLLDIDDVESGQPSRPQSVFSIPSVAVTPYDDDLNKNPWISSTGHLDHLARPTTPPNPRHLLITENTPYFTANSAPAAGVTSPVRGGILARTESSPAGPQTPTRAGRAPSPPKMDATLGTGPDVTNQQGIFRNARGSISRLMPGPFLGPLSSGSLNSLVAESLRKGEGSPGGPIRSQSWRRPRPAINTRLDRNRRRSTTATSALEAPDLESGLSEPLLKSWKNTDSSAPPRERSHTGDFFGNSSSRTLIDTNHSSALLSSLNPSMGQSPTTTTMTTQSDDQRNETEQDSNGGEGSSSTSSRRKKSI